VIVMRCRTCLKQIDPYLDAALPDPQRTVFEAHVSGCPACAAELARCRELFSLVEESRVDDWTDTEKSWSEFRVRAAREDSEAQPKRRLLEVLIPVAVTGAAAAVALTLATMDRNPASPERGETPAVAEAPGDAELPAKDLVEVLAELDLYENLDCFEGVQLVAQVDPGHDADLIEELLKEVEG